MPPPFAVLALFAALLPSGAAAQHDGHGPHPEHTPQRAAAGAGVMAGGVHEHGLAVLRVVLDGGALEIELATPLDTLVGFEHAPRTAAQRAALEVAERGLRDGAALFGLPEAAGCALMAVSLASPWLQSEDRADAGGAAHVQAGDGDHGELVAGYRFQCARPQALDALQLRLFELFPRLRAVRAEWASARGQGAAKLTRGQARLAL